MNNLFYLFIGYTGFWIIIFSFILYMNNKLRDTEQKLADFEKYFKDLKK
ncbi:MAG: hypothetical protein DK305_000501 [Chloroflexi bacterium]|jgi:CcmD family protein|nr:MAG: hypothetical protein DK305_000501 [Chloroflexota bacterium]|tara:strand:+ start:961 stop:1107 length:147 start_codon:yes stop_codon:yes gene_type:complete